MGVDQEVGVAGATQLGDSLWACSVWMNVHLLLHTKLAEQQASYEHNDAICFVVSAETATPPALPG
jgi:hypothetical protein